MLYTIAEYVPDMGGMLQGQAPAPQTVTVVYVIMR